MTSFPRHAPVRRDPGTVGVVRSAGFVLAAWVLSAALVVAGCSGASRRPALPPPAPEPPGTERVAPVPIPSPQPSISAAAAAAVHSEAELEVPPTPPPFPADEHDEEPLTEEPEAPAPSQPATERRTARADSEHPWLVYEEVYAIDELRFAPGSAELDDAARALLDQLVTRLRLEDAGYLIEIRGHTDATGSEAANLQLGERRARAVRDHLHRVGGVPLHRLSTLSLGDEQPVAGNDTAAGRARNRRAAVLVLRPSLFVPAPDAPPAHEPPSP